MTDLNTRTPTGDDATQRRVMKQPLAMTYSSACYTGITSQRHGSLLELIKGLRELME